MEKNNNKKCIFFFKYMIFYLHPEELAASKLDFHKQISIFSFFYLWYNIYLLIFEWE